MRRDKYATLHLCSKLEGRSETHQLSYDKSFMVPPVEWDAFISHATEDKAFFVNELATELRRFGLQVWFDAFELRIGDSLRESIERGLARSRFGIVVLSPSFFAKQWPQKELNGLFAREAEGVKVILPIWHQITKAELLKHSPILADMFAGNSNVGVPDLAKQLVDVIRPGLLQPEQIRRRTVEAVDRLREHCRDESRGIDCRITSGEMSSGHAAIPLRDKHRHLASVENDSMRIDFIATDAEKYNLNPLQMKLKMSADAFDKIAKAHRTGEATTISGNEIYSVTCDLFDVLGLPRNCPPLSLTLSTPLDLLEKRLHLRIKFIKADELVEYPFVEMKPIRVGACEVEFRSVKPLGAFQLSFVLPLDQTHKGRMNLQFLWDGCEVSNVAQCVKAMTMLHKGGAVELFDLAQDKLLGHFREPTGFAWIEDAGFHEFINSLFVVSQRTGAKIYWRGYPSDTDVRNSMWLNEIVSTGELSLSGDQITVQLDEGQFEATVRAIQQGEGLRFLSNMPPDFCIVFGQRIDVGPYQILIHAVELEVIQEKSAETGLIEAKIRFEKPLRYIFDRFLRSDS